MTDKRLFKNFDKTLLVVTFLIFIIGLATIHSATQAKDLSFNDSYVLKQINSMAIGIILLIIIIKISYQRFIDLSYILYLINIGLLALVLVLGHVRLGAQRWFSIGGFAFQPSEFIKLNLILALSCYVGTKKDSMKNFTNLIIPCILLAVPFVLVLLQPDLGTALLLLPIFFSILLVSGVEYKYLIGMLVLGLSAMPVFWHFLREYQRQRLLVFINPNVDPLGAGYTIIQSKIAVGSGGLFGKGWLAGTQNQLNFLPERHTDFIFSVIGEEWGYFGAIVVIFLYFFIIQRALIIASQTSDAYGRAIATGIASMLAVQVVINISMTIGLMPVVGIPLPMISYGGSSLITTLVAVGFLLNVGMRRSTF